MSGAPDVARVQAGIEWKRGRWKPEQRTLVVSLFMADRDTGGPFRERVNTREPSDDGAVAYAVLCAVELAIEQKPGAHEIVVTNLDARAWGSNDPDALKYRRVAEKLAREADMKLEVEGA